MEPLCEFTHYWSIDPTNDEVLRNGHIPGPHHLHIPTGLFVFNNRNNELPQALDWLEFSNQYGTTSYKPSRRSLRPFQVRNTRIAQSRES